MTGEGSPVRRFVPLAVLCALLVLPLGLEQYKIGRAHV